VALSRFGAPSRLAIRTRITGGSLIIAILMSLVAGVVIYSQVQRIVSDGQVAVLKSVEAPYLISLKEDASGEIDSPGPKQLVGIAESDGTLSLSTLPRELGNMAAALIESAGTTRTHHVDGASYLVRVTEVSSTHGDRYVISAVNNEVETSVLNQVAALIIASIAGINIAFGVASWLIGTAALRPVGQLRVSAAELVKTSGSELLPVGPANDEISYLATTLNELISQLRASAERERQIVSDASHEIRTPLAIMSTQLELAQAQALSLPQMQDEVRATQATLARLVALATSMLELSRIDAQARPGHESLSELAIELADAADRGRGRVGGRDIRIDYAIPADPDDEREVAISAADFARLCDNLVGNSLAAMGGAGWIDLVLSTDEHGARLSIADSAGGMPEAFVPLAFDRFSRPDARTGIGAGLGLAIVHGIVKAAGGAIELDNRPGVGLTVRVALPFVASA
jgi:signal transduction histidine kinase